VCNTSNSSEVVWTLHATNLPFTEYPEFHYIFVNGSIVDYVNFLITYSVVSSTNLKINNIYPTDSGFYDCEKTNGERVTGYYVDAARMYLTILGSKEYINHDSFVSSVSRCLSTQG